VSNTIVATEKNSWLQTERRASLLRMLLVVAVHVVVLAALLSWSWSPAPIEVSILSLEDLGGEVPASQEVPAQERSTPEVDAAGPAPELLPAAVAPARELAQLQQIDIALSQLVPPAPESQVAPELAPEQLPEAQTQPTETPDTTPIAPTASTLPTASTSPTAPTASTVSTVSTSPTASTVLTAPTPIPTPTQAAAIPTVRTAPDVDAPSRSRSVTKVTTAKEETTATTDSTQAENTAATGRASGSAQPGAGTEPALTAARFDADYLHNPAPAYPAQSRRLKEEGTVLLLVRVSTEGTPLSVEIRNSSGFERLDEAGLQAVRQWRFVPAKRGSDNVVASVLVPIQFKRQ